MARKDRRQRLGGGAVITAAMRKAGGAVIGTCSLDYDDIEDIAEWVYLAMLEAKAGAPAYNFGLSPETLEAASRVASDWLLENRDVIDAGGEGDVRELVRRVVLVLAGGSVVRGAERG